MSALPAFLFFLFSAFLFSFPLWTAGHALIPGGLEDTQLFLWNAWWGHQAWIHAVPHLYETSFLFQPFGASLITHDMPLWMTIVTDGVQALGGSLILSVNIWFVLTWALNGFCVYLLVREITHSRAPSLVGGLFVMTHAYTLARAMENWGQFNLYGLALFLWLLLRARRRGDALASVATGVALAWTAACHYYFFIYALVIWGAVILSDVSPWRISIARAPTAIRWRSLTGITLALLGGIPAVWIMAAHPAPLHIQGHWVGLESPANALLFFWIGCVFFVLAFWRMSVTPRAHARVVLKLPHRLIALSAFVGLAPLLWKALPLIGHGDYPRQHILWKTHLAGANLWALLSPNPLQAWWGTRVSGWFTRAGLNPQEEASMIGWVCLATVVWSRVWRSARMSRWLGLAVGSTILSMGIYLHAGALNLWCPLPFYAARLLPLLENVRVPERWMAVGAIAWAVVFAAALKALADKKSWPLNRVCLAAGLLVLVENWPGIPFVPPPPVSALYQTLKDEPAGTVLPLPFYAGDSSIGAGDSLPSARPFPWEHLWAQIHHEKPIVGGYIGRVPRRLLAGYTQDPFWGQLIQWEEGHPGPLADPTPEDVRRAIQRAQVRYCLMYASALRPAARAFIQRTLPLEMIASDGDLTLYRVKI